VQIVLAGEFRAPDPPLGHLPPGGSIFRIMGELGHELALGGMSQKFFRRYHQAGLHIVYAPRHILNKIARPERFRLAPPGFAVPPGF
jgi:hypothetical protein